MDDKEVIFITGNEFKVKNANNFLKRTGVKLIAKKIACPEIQDKDVEEVAKFSAKYAANELNQPVVKNDCGFTIEAFNGFPGPFMAYVEEWLGKEGFLKLMDGVENRQASFVEVTAYCEPGKEPITFQGETKGKIATKLQGEYGWGADFFFIPDGKDKTLACYNDDERGQLWNNEHWIKFAEFIKKKN